MMVDPLWFYFYCFVVLKDWIRTPSPRISSLFFFLRLYREAGLFGAFPASSIT